MKISAEGLALLMDLEDVRLLAYDDNGNEPGGVWTIGVGCTRYPPWHHDGRRVRQGDVCTRQQAMEFLQFDLAWAEAAVDKYTVDGLLPRQNDALVIFTFNIGPGRPVDPIVDGYSTSTVRRLVNANPNDPKIRDAFRLWHTGNGIPGRLWRRRHLEGDHYFGTRTPIPPNPYKKAA